MTGGNSSEHAPQWLTVEYLQKVFDCCRKDKAPKLLKLSIKPATNKGDNYASVMTRIQVQLQNANGERQTQNYIVKTSYENDAYLAELMRPYDCYNTEMQLYQKVLPQLNDLLHEVGIADELFAKTLHVDFENEAIIFEDLAVINYTVANRLKGMNMQHAQWALRKLAQMHAAAAVLNQRQQGALEKYSRGIFNRHTRNFGIIFEHMIDACADFAAECPQLGAYYYNKLSKLRQHVVEYATRVHDRKPGHFYTLIHGDFWVNNMMLRYLQNEQCNAQIEDLKLIDFQFSVWSTPAVDLHYFFNTSLEPELRLSKQHELIKYYYDVLHKYLLKLGYNSHIPTLHEFCVQMEEAQFVALTSALASHVIMINEHTKDADLNSLISSDERGQNFRRICYTQKPIQENAIKLLPYFDSKGLLDVQD